MKFEIAVAAILAAEKLSSSGVAAGGSLSEVQERATLRKEAIEAVTKEFPTTQRRALGEDRPSRNLLQQRLTNASKEKIQKLKVAVKKHEQRKRRERALGSDAMDLGILLEKAPKHQERKQKLFSAIQKVQSMKKATVSNPVPSEFQNTDHDVGVVKSTESIQRLVNALSLDKSTSSDSLPDLGIFSKESESVNRHLEDVFGDFDQSQMLTAPLAFTVNMLCLDTEASQYCDSCRVEYNDAANPSAGYSLYLDCDVPEGYEQDTEYLTANFNQLCSYGLCKGGCEIDPDKFAVELKDCSVMNMPGVSEELSDILPDGGDLSDLADLYSGIDDVLNSNYPLASSMDFLCETLDAANEVYGTNVEFCTACEVTYLDSIGESKPYDVVMDCPNIPGDLQEQDYSLDESLEGIENLCSYGVCETCVFEENSLKFELRNCSVSFFGYSVFDGIFDDSGNIADSGTTDSYYESSGGSSAQYLKSYLEYYFSGICGSEELICGASTCGPLPDSDSILSFEFDCPAVLGLPGAGFGTYVAYAQGICAGQAQFGLQCGTCDVNPFEATIKIDDCQPLTAEEQAAAIGVTQVITDEFAFMALYTESCNPEIVNYLQDVVDQPKCACTFDATTKRASLSCDHNELCQQFPSYCDEPLEMCDSYTVTASFSLNKSVSLQRCVDASFNTGGSADFSGPYQFTYCVSYGMPEGAVNASEASGNECEMEVQGVRCNSCSVDINETYAAYYGFDPTGVVAAMSLDSSIMYNCDNTVLGANGTLSRFKLLDDTLAYFSYRSLPCSGGCDLCGDGKQFMSNPDAKFTTKKWKDNTEDTCFAAQLEAMTLKEPLSEKECKDVRDAVREPCGCKNLDTSSGVLSFGKGFSATSSMVLTIVAASVVQMLLG